MNLVSGDNLHMGSIKIVINLKVVYGYYFLRTFEFEMTTFLSQLEFNDVEPNHPVYEHVVDMVAGKQG